MAVQPGDLLHQRYRIQKKLGRGGFGAIYLALDELLNRPCAVKENLDSSDEAERQFQREAQFLAQLDDPGLPDVYDYFTLPRQGQYLVMDYIDGEDLMSRVEQRGPLPPAEAVHWVREVGQALVYLHNQKKPVIHRDVKPANIILTNGKDRPVRAMLVDFGLAKTYATRRKTTHGARAISPGFSPPEQYTLRGTDARSDIYALGATLYYLLTGREPLESAQRMMRDTLLPPHERNRQVDRDLSQVVMQSMALKPEARYPAMTAFLEALQQVAPVAVTGVLPAAKKDVGPASPPLTPPAGLPPMEQEPERAAEPPPAVETIGELVGKQEEQPEKPAAAARPEQSWRDKIPTLAFAFIALCLIAMVAALAVTYVNDFAFVAATIGSETPAGGVALTEPTTPPPTNTPLPSATPTLTLPPPPSATPTRTPSPTNTPLPPAQASATAQSAFLFDQANALATPAGNVVLIEVQAIDLPHGESGNLPTFADVNIAQEDFVIRAVFVNPYDANDGAWDYGFFLRVQPNGERLEVSIASGNTWRLQYYRDESDTDGLFITGDDIRLLNLGARETNALAVILNGDLGYLIVNDNEIFPLDLSLLDASGTIRVATGIRPDHQQPGAVTQFTNLSIRDLNIE